MRRPVVVAAVLALLGATVSSAAQAGTPAAYMSCGFPPKGGSKGSITYRQHPESCFYSGDGSGSDLISLVEMQWEDWGQPEARATGKRVDTHDQDRNGFQRHPVQQIVVKGLKPAVGDAGGDKLYYTNLIVTFEDGGSYTWTLYRPAPRRAQTPASRTCGSPPDGLGAYRYIQTRGIRCAPAYRIAFRARKRFCGRNDDCRIDPYVSIGQVYRGKTRYRGWTCRVKVGWESTRVRCRKREMRLLYRSAA